MKPSYKQILLERVEIRCAIWAAGLITEEQLNEFVNNCNKYAETIETKKESYLKAHGVMPYLLTYKRAITFISSLKESNTRMLEKHL